MFCLDDAQIWTLSDRLPTAFSTRIRAIARSLPAIAARSRCMDRLLKPAVHPQAEPLLGAVAAVLCRRCRVGHRMPEFASSHHASSKVRIVSGTSIKIVDRLTAFHSKSVDIACEALPDRCRTRHIAGAITKVVGDAVCP